MACVETGGGSLVTFKAVTDIGRIRSISVFGETGSSVDNTSLEDGVVKMCPGDLVDYGSLDVTVLWDAEARTAWDHADMDVHDQGSLVLTFGSNNHQVVGDAFILSKSVGDFVNNQEIVCNYTFVWTADGTPPTVADPV